MTIQKRTEKELLDMQRDLRIRLLTMIYRGGSGHTGGSLSSIDILIALYFSVMKYDPLQPDHPDRDRFIMSKGHSVEALYVVLAEAGYFPKEELDTYGRFDTRLYGHPTMKVPGVEVPSGALGHGLSVGVGMALVGKREQLPYSVYVLLGDGELAEGSVWEAAMAAAHYHLNNITAIIDYNRLQISGRVDEVMRSSSLPDKWRSFGWQVNETDGNDMNALLHTFSRQNTRSSSKEGKTRRPRLIIAHTTKGKGISFIENQAGWHHKVPTAEQLDQAVEEIKANYREAMQ